MQDRKRICRRTLAAVLIAGGVLAAGVPPAINLAHAAYTAGVAGGTLTITGDGASDKLALRLAPGSPNVLQVDVGDNGSADFQFDRSTFTNIVVNAGPGKDEIRVDQVNGAFTDESLTMDGGDGNDSMIGGSGAEIFLGGTGADFVEGNMGADLALLGSHVDTFRWDPGDGSDTLEGQAGDDVLDFNGANIAESFDLAANGGRVRFFRNIANVTMDMTDVERLDLEALGGADVLTVADMAGTDLTRADARLGGGDASADSVIVNGTAGGDHVEVRPLGGGLVVRGLTSEVRVTGAEAGDGVAVNGLTGSDTITGFKGLAGPAAVDVDGGLESDVVRFRGSGAPDTLQASVVDAGQVAIAEAGSTTRLDAIAEDVVLQGLDGPDTLSGGFGLDPLTDLLMDGGGGGDTILGGDGADIILGGAGPDFVEGNNGDDLALLGSHGDTFRWDPGDDNDTVEGQTGEDVLDFNGSAVAETFDLFPNGGRVLLFRNIANVTMDMDDVERLDLDALGGTDLLTVADMAGTDLTRADARLSAFGGGGDASTDNVIVNGTSAADDVEVRPLAGGLLVRGLASEVAVTEAEATDRVAVNSLGGSDTITGFKGLAGPAAVDVDGGAESDTVRFDGTEGADAMGAAVVDAGQVGVAEAGASTRLDAVAEDVVLRGFGGPDALTGGFGLAALTDLLLDGGVGNDVLSGGDGDDVLLGGSEFDQVEGNAGADLALLGSHGDTFRWDPGDGSDTVEGQAGADVLDFNGSAIAENFNLLPNGGRVSFLRDIANVTMDVNGVERLALETLAGTDVLTVNNMNGTDLARADVDLGAGPGGGDGAADDVILNGTNGVDNVGVNVVGGEVVAQGLVPRLALADSEAANDQLFVNTLGGNDNVNVGAGVTGLIQVVVDLGPGE